MHEDLRGFVLFKKYFLAIILLIACLSISISLFLILREKRDNYQQTIFKNQTIRAKETIQQRISNYFLLLRSSQALFSSSDTVTRHEWLKFVMALDIEKHYPGSIGIAYAFVIKQNQVPEITSRGKKEINSEYKVWPNTHDSIKAPIVFWKEFAHQMSPLGYDVLSETTRKKAIELSIEYNTPIVSNRITLVTEQDSLKQPGFLILIPVFENNVSLSSIVDRRRYIRGIIISPFRSYDFFKATMKREFPELEIEIFDSSLRKQNLIYDNDESNSLIGQGYRFRTIEKINYNGNAWQIVFDSKQRLISSSEFAFPIIVLFTGVFISFLIFIITWIILHNKLKSDINQKIIQEKNNQLSKINRDLDNFVYTASHDLKAPITNLEGLVDLVDEEVKKINNGTLSPIIKMVGDSIDKLKTTIKDLTEIGRIQKDTENIYETISFRDLINEVLFNYQNDIIKTKADIKLDLKEKYIKYSKKNLRSILDNLISNALKYHSPDRDLKILIQTYTKGNLTYLCIKDNGLGIPENQQQKVFMMFKRAHDHVPGSGVGLYLIKRIMENSEGKVMLKSKEDEGSIFTLIFKKVN